MHQRFLEIKLQNVDTNHDGCHNTLEMCTSNFASRTAILVQRYARGCEICTRTKGSTQQPNKAFAAQNAT